MARPFTLDEPFYLEMARHIRKDPLRPYSFPINWSGEAREVWKENEATFPPLLPYLLAGSLKLLGEKEAALRLTFLPFSALAAFCIVLLGRRYLDRPIWPALLVLLAPAFWPYASTFHLDIPALALGLAGLALFQTSLLRRMGWEGLGFFAAGLLGGLAGLVKYPWLSVAMLFAWMEICFCLSLRRSLRAWVGMAIPLGIWCVHNLAVYGELHFLRAWSATGGGVSLHKLLALPSFVLLGWVFPFLLAWPLWRAIRLRLFTLDAKTTFLLGWLGFELGRLLLQQPWVSARYTLSAIVPAALILCRCAEVALVKPGRLLAAAAGLTGLLGLSTTAADVEWSRHLKEAALLSAELGATHYDGRFTFHYYARGAGLKPLDFRNPPPPGSRVAVAKWTDEAWRGGRLRSLPYRMLRQIALGCRWPVRVMHPPSSPLGAGFHSSFWGILPYAIGGSDPIAEVEIREADFRQK